MSEQLVTNRPTRRDFVLVNRAQFDHIFTDSAVAKGDEIAKNLATLKDDIAPACDKTFVMMKNKQVWFDRNNSALFPKFESGVLHATKTRNPSAPTRGYALDFEGFVFVPMTSNEFDKSFVNGTCNPYLQSNGNFKFFPKNIRQGNEILTEELSGSDDSSHVRRSDGSEQYWHPTDDEVFTIVPIHRLRGKNAAAMSYHDAFFTWIQIGLVHEGLTNKQEKFFSKFH